MFYCVLVSCDPSLLVIKMWHSSTWQMWQKIDFSLRGCSGGLNSHYSEYDSKTFHQKPTESVRRPPSYHVFKCGELSFFFPDVFCHCVVRFFPQNRTSLDSEEFGLQIDLPSIQDLQWSRVRNRTAEISADPMHPACKLLRHLLQQAFYKTATIETVYTVKLIET